MHLYVKIVGSVIASSILNGVEIAHLLPYKPCELSGLFPLWMSMCSSLALSLFLLSVSLHPFGFFHTFTFTRWCPPLLSRACIVMLVVMGCICASVYPQWLQSKITPVMHAGCEWWFSAHRGTISQTQPLKPLHSFSACLSVSRNICLLIKVCLHSTVCLADGYIKKYSYVLTSCVAWWFSANLLLIKQERQEWSCTVQKEECLYTSMYKYLDPFVF